MKTDLTTAVVAAIIGAVSAFFICGLFLPRIEDVKYKTIEVSVKSTVENPDEDIFNPKAINPTVGVCVGQCEEEDTNSEEYIDEETDEEWAEDEENVEDEGDIYDEEIYDEENDERENDRELEEEE